MLLLCLKVGAGIEEQTDEIDTDSDSDSDPDGPSECLTPIYECS
ncbi:hypothetical protein D3OALGA1CA_338 [Olavius algarvensis associated proteobacterium Delta 3]|nr:hypothetical protein D3OALGA1CA_338 [Olavius algarvensis associated proteobacterium Delta 3]CAB5097740.1 hypothetical protein D3OALGB2SA_1621 [Olavius algarvensis associated proteobacterium Delta 3]